MGTTTDDYIIPSGRIAGVRTWRLANTMWARMGGWLWSLAMTDCWRKGAEWKEAECHLGHRVPGGGCMCGIWAFYNLELMDQEFGAPVVQLGEPFEYVRGVIVADGDIVVHEHGFRAQYAKVAAIFEDGLDTAAPKPEIASHYQCDIMTPDDYDLFCIKHGLRRLDLE